MRGLSGRIEGIVETDQDGSSVTWSGLKVEQDVGGMTMPLHSDEFRLPGDRQRLGDWITVQSRRALFVDSPLTRISMDHRERVQTLRGFGYGSGECKEKVPSVSPDSRAGVGIGP